MKILNFYFLAIHVVIVSAQDLSLSVRVVKYKDTNDNVVTLTGSNGPSGRPGNGTNVVLIFLNANTEEDNNVKVSLVKISLTYE